MLLGYIDPGTGFSILSTGVWFFAFCLGLFGVLLAFLKRTFPFFKKHRKVLIVAIAAGLIIIGITMNKKMPGFNKKIIIIGFDGLSPQILEPMMAQNQLPNFSKLKENGSYRRLATTNPAQSPVAWTAMATGKNPGKTGVFDFIVRDPKNYHLRLSLSNIEKGSPKRVIKTKCFWQYASQRKIPAVIITCPVTFPPDKINGRMLSGAGVPDILGTEGTFTFYTTELLDQNKDIGGQVFSIRKSPVMTLRLIGPRIITLGQGAKNAEVPFKVALPENKKSAVIEYQGHKLELKAGQWSDFREVSFKIGLFRKIKGIVKFFLVETEPNFKLYISPINFHPRQPFFPISYPKNYSRDLADKIGFYYTQGMPFHTWAVNEGRLTEEAFLTEAEEILKEKKAMLDWELQRFKAGILFCYFESPDIIQHMFWRYFASDSPPQYKEIIKNWYQKMDQILGKVIKNLNQDDTLIVLSDHGFNTFKRAVHLNTWLRKNGYLELEDSSAESGAELLADIDWTRTRAYALGFGAIYINQKGREKNGLVAPGQETALIKKEIAQKLKEWRDEQNHQPVVNEVYPREDIFWGKYSDQTPDLYLGFKQGYRASWQTALGAVPKDLIEENLKKWSGDHLFDPALVPGIIFSNRKITQEKPTIYDLTPTILKLIGFQNKELKRLDFDGQPLF